MGPGRRSSLAIAFALSGWLSSCGDTAPRDSALAIEVDAGLRARIAALSPLPDLPPDPPNGFADDPAAAGRLLLGADQLGGVALDPVSDEVEDPSLSRTNGHRIPTC